MAAVSLPDSTLARDRCELYRLLAEPVRLRLLALAAEEELAVGELAELLGEAQPNVSRHAAPLRQAGLVSVRRQGTRALVRLTEGASADAVVADALAAGRSLCVQDGSFDRIAEVLRARDAASRAFFAGVARETPADGDVPRELGAYLAALAPLIPQRRLAVDAATGDGGLLDVLAPVFEKVVAFDREEVQLARCRERVARRGWGNVEVLRGEVDGDDVRGAVARRGGADVVFAARFLHHAPRPAAAVRALARLVRPGGAIVVLDYARHDDEAMREQADLWLGFEPAELRRYARAAGLDDVHLRGAPLLPARAALPDAHLAWQIMVARKPPGPKQPLFRRS